jgi:hypothetical protein
MRFVIGGAGILFAHLVLWPERILLGLLVDVVATGYILFGPRGKEQW